MTGGARDLPSREQILCNTIDWSYELLGEEGKTLFARLGVFVGGCTLESAEAVCGQGLDLLVRLGSLVDKSLVRCSEKEGETRFMMLASLHEYALDKLAAGYQR